MPASTETSLPQGTRPRDEPAVADLKYEFLHAQRLSLVGQLAGGAAHDLNNTLSAINLLAQWTADQPQLPPTAQSALRDLQRHVERGTRVTQQLLGFARNDRALFATHDLRVVVDDAASLLVRIFPRNIDVIFNRPPVPLNAVVDEGMLQQTLMNLCVNARDAMPHGGTLTFELRTFACESVTTRPTHAGSHLHCISIADTGCGIAPENLTRIFEPFFTTKARGSGTGLGLSTVARIVELQGGKIDVVSAVGAGTEFRIYLPAS